MNPWKVIAIIAILLLLFFAGVYSFDKTRDYYFNEGYKTGTADIILRINQNGEIPVLYQEDNQTLIKWVAVGVEE